MTIRASHDFLVQAAYYIDTRARRGIGEINVQLKTLVRVATLTAASALSAYAADMPMSAPEPMEPPAPIFDWSGPYAGVNGGFAWANAGKVSIADPINGTYTINAKSGTGFVGGIQAGYNLQSDVLISGIEADIQYSGVGSSVNWGPYGFLGVSSKSQAEYFGTLRVRGGFTVDRTFFYLTGGLAYGSLNSSPLGGAPSLNLGYALGGGAEYAFTDHWTAKIEGLYVNLGSGNAKTIYVANAGNIYPIRATTGSGAALVRVGVNYKF
jgi:outer membrane immunogenic protein